MDSKPPIQRKAYQKPEISRVDLVEDEVALAACKSDLVTAHAGPNAGVNVCKQTPPHPCKLQGRS